jgi:hypothetical protein
MQTWDKAQLQEKMDEILRTNFLFLSTSISDHVHPGMANKRGTITYYNHKHLQ